MISSMYSAKLLKHVISNDAYLKNLSATQKGISDLNKFLSNVIGGPTSLELQWNQALFDGWGKANSALMRINKTVTCDALMDPIMENSPNASFFEKLRNTRGCD